MEFVYASIISVIGMVIFLLFSQRFWIRKWDLNFKLEKFKTDENYKFEKYKIKNRQVKNPAPKDLSFWMNKAKGLDPNQIADMIDIFKGEGSGDRGAETGLSGNPVIDGILGYVQDNPEIASKFLSQMGGKKSDQDQIKYES